MSEVNETRKRVPTDRLTYDDKKNNKKKRKKIKQSTQNLGHVDSDEEDVVTKGRPQYPVCMPFQINQIPS